MTISIVPEQLTAVAPDGSPMGRIEFPRIRRGLVNIRRVTVAPAFRHQGVEDAMLAALLAHLAEENQKAVLADPCAQRYVAGNPQWKAILPDGITCVTH